MQDRKTRTGNYGSMIIKQAIEVLKIEAEGILNLIDRIDHNFTQMVELIYSTKGRVIVGGIGKSGLVGQKIVATLNSTGTRSFFCILSRRCMETWVSYARMTSF